MRKFILLTIATIFFIASATAQDIIVFRDTNEVAAKVTAIAQDNVSYKRWDNLDGPVYTVNKADVFYIKYQNGLKDIFESTTTNQSNNIFTKSIGTPKYSFNGIKFQSYIYAGATFLEHAGGPTIDINIGARIYDYFYIGIETGFRCVFEEIEYFGYRYDYERWYEDSITAKCGYIPIGVNLKGYIPTGKKIYPYINCSLGGFIGVMDLNGLNGFYCQVGAGIDIKRFSFGIGYTGLVKESTANCGYVKLGVRLGKW